MDYDKFSESSDVNSTLADRLNNALSAENNDDEVVSPRKKRDLSSTSVDSDTIDGQTSSVVANESRGDDMKSVSETDSSKEACLGNLDSGNEVKTEKQLDDGSDKIVDPVNGEDARNISGLESKGEDNEKCENETESKHKSNESDSKQMTDDSDDEYLSEESGSEVEYESADEGEEIQRDKQNLQELEDELTDEQKEEKRLEAGSLKEEGNELFRQGSYKSAIRIYSRALRTCPLKYPKDRAIMYSNRAACKMRLEDLESSIQDCTKALDLHPHYLKALMRRAELYEKTEKLDEALADNQKIVELDPSQHSARAACMRLPDQIKERNEKLKEEMMGKLKDLGNMILRPFGLSTNNFQLNQDPNSGGYSVNFVQNPQQNS